MAKKGEGDARWIVESREDGRNVNQWHWEEKNLTPYVKSQFESAFSAGTALLESDNAKCVVTKHKNFDGEVTIVVRKGRTRYLYDLGIELEWCGSLIESGEELVETSGVIKLSDIEQDEEDFTITINCSGAETKHHHTLKDLIKDKGFDVIREKVKAITDDLKSKAKTAKAGTSVSSNSGGDAKDALKGDVEAKQPEKKKKSAATTIKKTERFRASASDIFECFTEANRARVYTRSGNVQLSASPDAPMSLYDGSITGKTISCVKDGGVTKLTQEWRLKGWDSPSLVELEISFDEDERCTVLKLNQSNVPAEEKERTSEGWERMYFTPIRQTFGYIKP